MRFLIHAARSICVTIAVLSCLGCGVSLRSPITSKSSDSTVAIPTTAAERTADDASRIAMTVARNTLDLADPQVRQVTLMVPDRADPNGGRYVAARSDDDPATLVWLAKVDESDASATECPPPPRGVDQTICWYPTIATIAISVMTGEVIAIHAPYPSAASAPGAKSIQIPASSKLKTRQDAMTAGFALVPGKDGARPTIIDVRVLSGREWVGWLKQQGIHDDLSGVDPTMVIWVLEFTHAALAQDCTSDNAASCVHDHLYLSIDAASGKSLGFVFPAHGSPANFTP